MLYYKLNRVIIRLDSILRFVWTVERVHTFIRLCYACFQI